MKVALRRAGVLSLVLLSGCGPKLDVLARGQEPDASNLDTPLTDAAIGQDSGDGAGDDGRDTGARLAWYGLGNSELSPWTFRPNGSASGGGISRSASAKGPVRAFFDALDRPIVSYFDGWYKLFRWNGSRWEDLGVSQISSGGEKLASDSAGKLYAFTGKQVYGSGPAASWGVLAGALDGVTAAPKTFDIIVDGNDHPVIGYVSPSGYAVRAWNGKSWEDLGPVGIEASSLYADAQRRPVVASSLFTDDTHFRVYQGNAWVDTGIAWPLVGGNPAKISVDGSSVIARRWTGSIWETSPPLTVTQFAGNYYPDGELIKATSNGDLIIRWVDYIPYKGVIGRHKIWSGSDLRDLAPPSGPDTSAFLWVSGDPYVYAPTDNFALAVDSKGGALFVWREGMQSEVYARLWTGSAFTELGERATGRGVSDSPGARSPSIAIDPDGHPVVAWLRQTTGPAVFDEWGTYVDGLGYGGPPQGGKMGIYARRWNGTQWEELAGSGTGDGILPWPDSSVDDLYAGLGSGDAKPRLLLDAAGNPLIGWRASWTRGDFVRLSTYLKTWNGTAWRGLGESGEALGLGSSSSCGGSALRWFDPSSLVLGPGGNPMMLARSLAWTDDCHEKATDAQLFAWDGSAWGPAPGDLGNLGPDGAIAGNAFTAMATDAHGYPVIVIFSPPETARVRRYNGTAWEALGDAEFAKLDSSFYGLSVEVDQKGNPVVGWSGGANILPSLHFARWTGTTWQDLGGPPIKALGHLYDSPYAMTLNDNGNPVVVWEDSSSGELQIYLRRWTGTFWEDVGGSSGGGGVSNGSGAAHNPAVAARGNKICAAWHEMATWGPEIAVRCTDL